MNNFEIQSELSPCDPSWEYFTIYGQLQTVKTEFDAILLHIGSIEHPQKTDDYEIRAKLFNLIAKLRVISHNL